MASQRENRPVNVRWVRRASAAFAAALAAATGAANCADQRPPECTTGLVVSDQLGLVAGYPTRFDLISQSGTCAEGEVLRGGLFGIQTYYQRGSDGYADFDQPANVAIQFDNLGKAVRDAQQHLDGFDRKSVTLYSLGRFTTPQPSGDRCTVTGLSPVDVSLPAIPADPGDPEDADDDFKAKDAVRYRIEWQDVQFLVTTGYPGNQFTGRVTIQVNDCVGVYQATGVYGTNRVTCEGDNGEANPALCSPVADPDAQVFAGTGINPDFPVRCDEELKLCVLDGEFPAIRKLGRRPCRPHAVRARCALPAGHQSRAGGGATRRARAPRRPRPGR
jgi:hypothetical protein